MTDAQNPNAEPMQLPKGDAGAGGQAPQATPPQPPTGGEDVAQLITKLDQLGVKSTKDLDGMAFASRSAGKAAQELGAAREEIRQLRTLVEESARRQPPARQSEPLYDDGFGSQNPPASDAVDLRSELKSVMRDFYREEVMAPQQQAQEVYWNDVRYIQNHHNFDVVKDGWESHVQQPAVQEALHGGSVSLRDVYHSYVTEFAFDIARRAGQALKSFSGTPPTGTQPPHMESGTSIPPTPTQLDQRNQKLRELEKTRTGTDTDIDKMLGAILPDGDPILQT